MDPYESTVRDATFEQLRALDMRTIYSNPGSTEVPFLVDLPDDLRFVLALHEGAVVAIATGHAIAADAPAFVLLHTTAGLGNAVSALATARVNRAPLVTVIGQQDRRHLALQPFLAGRLRGLAGEYPVWVDEPQRAQDVPGAIRRAHAEAITHRGPALVIVPMDDWSAPAPEPHELVAPTQVLRAVRVDSRAVEQLHDLLAAAARPALVVGAGADTPAGWQALIELAERLQSPVWQEAFGARAGFPQDHPLFAGHLPADRVRLRTALADYDVVLSVGAPIFRQYPYVPGPLTEPGVRLALISDDPDEVHRSPADLAVLGDPAAVCERLAQSLQRRAPSADTKSMRRPEAPPPPAAGESLRAGHVLHALAERLTSDTILLEETPSSRPELHRRIPARSPLGFLSAAMGGLGFALPAAIGVRMARPERPVVAVLGDGSSLYSIQGIWSAVQYEVGVLFIVLANGRYAIMDRLAERQHGSAPWPDFATVDIAAIARAFGCESVAIDTHERLLGCLDEVLPGLADRNTPLLVEVAVEADMTFEP
jgi:benzoylformate decarboxylase